MAFSCAEADLAKDYFRSSASGRYVTSSGKSDGGMKVIQGSRGERVVRVDKPSAASALRDAAGKMGRAAPGEPQPKK